MDREPRFDVTMPRKAAMKEPGRRSKTTAHAATPASENGKKKRRKNDRSPTAEERLLLESAYYDPSRGFKGVDALRRVSGLPLPIIRKFLRGSRAYTLHAPARRTHKRRPVNSEGFLYSQIGVDLIDLPKLAPRNDGFRYIMVCICQTSKKAHARPLKKKNATVVKKAFADIIDNEIAPHLPRFVHGDREGAFVSKEVKQYLREKYNVKIFAVGNAETKCAVASYFEGHHVSLYDSLRDGSLHRRAAGHYT